MRCARLIPLSERRTRKDTRPAGSVNVSLLGAEAAEDGERIRRLDRTDDLSARTDFAVQASRKRVGVVAARGADDEVLEAPLRLVALGAEGLRELPRLLSGGALHPHLPRGEATTELFRFPRLAGLVVPAVLVVEPVLDLAGARLGAVRAKLRFDDPEGLLGFCVAVRVDEDRVVAARDREPSRSEILRELARLGVELAGESLEEAGRVLLLFDLDPDPPVVFGHVASSLVCAGGLARAVRAGGGALRGGGGARSRRAATRTARERGLGGGAIAPHGR